LSLKWLLFDTRLKKKMKKKSRFFRKIARHAVQDKAPSSSVAIHLNDHSSFPNKTTAKPRPSSDTLGVFFFFQTKMNQERNRRIIVLFVFFLNQRLPTHLPHEVKRRVFFKHVQSATRWPNAA
jgi:hypothetical protein